MSKAYNEMSYVEVAAIYNDINNIPLDAAEQLGKSVAAIIGEGARILDMGGGAGRISVPIASNCDMIALDIEHHMQKASQKLAADRGIRIRNSVGTILKLPFASDTFSAVITTNVLHQVDCWRCAIREAIRVTRPGGKFIIGRDVLDTKSVAGRMRAVSRQFTGTFNPDMMPTDAAGPALGEFLEDVLAGTLSEEISACEWVEYESANSILQKMRERKHNETWSLDDATLNFVVEKMQAWVAEKIEDPDKVEEIKWSFGLVVVDGLK